MRTRRITSIVAVVIVAVALAGAAALAAAKTVGVKHSGNTWHWTPSNLTIKKGTTVTWHWKGKVPHNVTGKGFKSKTTTALTYKHKFKKAGTYKVVCTIHQSLGQRMTIKVK
jgi:plastocyanin